MPTCTVWQCRPDPEMATQLESALPGMVRQRPQPLACLGAGSHPATSKAAARPQAAPQSHRASPTVASNSDRDCPGPSRSGPGLGPVPSLHGSELSDLLAPEQHKRSASLQAGPGRAGPGRARRLDTMRAQPVRISMGHVLINTSFRSPQASPGWSSESQCTLLLMSVVQN